MKPLPPATFLPAKLDTAVAHTNSSSNIPPTNFDEQLGMTFTENFTSLSYNVSVVEQQDIYGYGPAYLLNGLSNLGYWYQVGFSWDWPIASGGYYSGFGFNYEVFSPNGSSIFPQNAGGLTNFTGPIHPGDKMSLSLAFNLGNVNMQAFDYETGATASVIFQSFGASVFVGLPFAISNSKGFFSGLMTEQYHPNIYNGSETKVIFSSNANISSAWLWVDEFNANSSSLIFLKSTPSPILFTANPLKLQYFFYEGAILSSSAHEFITGNSGSVLLTVNYAEIGGNPPVPPKFVFSTNGSIDSAQLGEKPQTFLVDNGSTWSVSNILSGPNSSEERWTTSNSTAGVAGSDETIRIVYYHQFLEFFSFVIVGGGSNAGSPALTFVNYGRPNSILLAGTPLELWGDAAMLWNSSGILPGSSSLERWVSNSTTGVFAAGENISLVYFHEKLVAVGYSISGGGAGYSPPQFQSMALNETLSRTLSPYPYRLWLNSGALWRVNAYLNGSNTGERWITSRVSGTVNQSVISPVYYHQSFVSMGYVVKGNSTGFDPPRASWISFGVEMNATLFTSRSIWADYGTSYNFTSLISKNAGDRWVADSDPSGIILDQRTLDIAYQKQYNVGIEQPHDGGGILLAQPSGWYNDSEVIPLAFRNNSGWTLGDWIGTGSGSYNGNSTDPTITVSSPITETVVFYPSLTIKSGYGGKVSYNYGGKAGTITGGQSVTIYVPPLSEVSVSAVSSSALNIFTSWNGTFNSASESILLQIHSPQKVEAGFGFNYPIISVSIIVIIGSVALIAASIYGRRKRGRAILLPESIHQI